MIHTRYEYSRDRFWLSQFYLQGIFLREGLFLSPISVKAHTLHFDYKKVKDHQRSLTRNGDTVYGELYGVTLGFSNILMTKRSYKNIKLLF